MNTEALAFIEYLDSEVERCARNLSVAREPYERGLWTGWRDAYQNLRDHAAAVLPKIEAEAFLVPNPDARDFIREEWEVA